MIFVLSPRRQAPSSLGPQDWNHLFFIMCPSLSTTSTFFTQSLYAYAFASPEILANTARGNTVKHKSAKLPSVATANIELEGPTCAPPLGHVYLLFLLGDQV